MDFNVLIFTKTDCYIEGMAKKEFITPKGIMWHSTGANNPNLKRFVGPDDGRLGFNANLNHWNQRRSRRVCPHAWIGKLKNGNIATYQCLPWNLRGWHSGGGTKGNANSLGYIGFEICEGTLTNKEYSMLAYQEAVELSADLCKKFNLNPLGKDVIIDHARGHELGIASNHGDVMHWFKKHYGITLDMIRKDIAAAMKIIEPEPEPTPTPQPSPIGPSNLPYKIRLTKGTVYYKDASGKNQAGKISTTTNYTITEESGNYGKLKSGAGWVQIKEDPVPDIEPAPNFKSYSIMLTKGTPYYTGANKHKVAGYISIPTNYTIVAEEKGFGQLKSGAGWIELKISPPKPEEPAPSVPKIVSTWAVNNKLQNGSKGKLVEAAQVALILRGFDVGGVVDGIFGAKTTAAVKALQKKFGFTQDGIIGVDSWPVLLGVVSGIVPNPSRLIQDWAVTNKISQGSKGKLVEVVQAALAIRKYDIGGVIDGSFGVKTTAAVKALQKKNKFTQDGIVGIDSWPALLG